MFAPTLFDFRQKQEQGGISTAARISHWGNERLWLHVLVAVVNDDMFRRLFEEVEERGAKSRRRGGEGEKYRFRRSLLCEGQPGFVVDLEDLLDGVDVGGRPQVQTQVVLARCAHDLLQKSNEDRY